MNLLGAIWKNFLKFLKRNKEFISVLIAISGMIITVVETSRQIRSNLLTSTAQSIINNRPFINGAYDTYNSKETLLSTAPIKTDELNNKQLPYFENTSHNIAENVKIILIYTQKETHAEQSYGIQLASLSPNKTIFVNNISNSDYYLSNIWVQCDSTHGETIRTYMGADAPYIKKSGFMVASTNLPWRTKVDVFDDPKFVKIVKQLNPTVNVKIRNTQGTFSANKKAILYNP